MKIMLKHLQVMKDAIDPILKANPNAWKEHEAQGHSAVRFNWDVARAAGLMPFICDTLYKYANDSHIYTALTKITAVR